MARHWWYGAALAGVLVWGAAGAGQELPDAPKPQPEQTQPQIPDAPSASKPSTPAKLPTNLPPVSPPPTTEENPPPAHPAITDIPAGQGQQLPSSARDQLYTLTKNVNFVLVPVTVKDSSGRLVEGLLPQDFTVRENNEKQKITFFTSDPFPLSAAVVLDVSLPQSTVKKITNTLSALAGAFSQFDEVGLYIYGNTVKKESDFTAINNTFYETLRRIRERQKGTTGGPPIIGGPLGQSTPTVNGRSIDPSQPSIAMPASVPDSHVLNDAILAAATDLAKRPKERRRIIFIISDGREYRSNASYTEVLKVLLSQQVQVYALGVDSAAIPIYNKLEKIPFPGRGTGNILEKYASATGGEVYDEFSQKSIEQAYARITEDARNQYTLGYLTRGTPSSAYRSIEVRVLRPDLKVYARDGYYPLPPAP